MIFRRCTDPLQGGFARVRDAPHEHRGHPVHQDTSLASETPTDRPWSHARQTSMALYFCTYARPVGTRSRSSSRRKDVKVTTSPAATRRARVQVQVAWTDQVAQDRSVVQRAHGELRVLPRGDDRHLDLARRDRLDRNAVLAEAGGTSSPRCPRASACEATMETFTMSLS